MSATIAYYGGIVTDGLVLYMDAAKRDSYPGFGTNWNSVARGGLVTGSLINGPTFSYDNGGSIRFDGTNDYLDLNIVSNVNEKNFSFSFWFLNLGTQRWRDFAALGINTPENNALVFERGGNNGQPVTNGFFKVYPLPGPNYTSNLIDVYFPGVFVADSNFHYFCITANGTQWDLYWEGSVFATGNVSGEVTNYFNKLILGSDVIRGAYSSCRIYNVSLYNRGLTSEEVIRNYNATKGRFGL